MKTAVMTDTNSGITKQEADALGIFLMQMPVIIDGETHYEGLDLTHDSFFAALTGNQNVSTSQPSPGDVMDMWDEILNSGYDEIIYIPMSSGLSASCEAAMGLALDYDGKVQVANNHRISVTMRISVMEAKHYADLGASAAKIKELLETNAFNSSIYIAVDTLEFLKRGGRVTAAGAGLSADQEKEWTDMLSASFPEMDVYYDSLSFSISCHIGPGGYGVGISVIGEYDL